MAFGKGIGFTKPPYDIPLSRIDRTFYDVDQDQIALLNKLPQDILEVSGQIVDLANERMGSVYPENAVFTLADHIDFSIQRHKKNITIQLPLFFEVRQLYPQESELGKQALALIREHCGVSLPREEAAAIAMHFVNYQAESTARPPTVDLGEIIDQAVALVEAVLGIAVDKDGFSYYRFVTHMHYMLKRTQTSEMIETQNEQIFDSLTREFPKIYDCALRISELIEERLDQKPTDEEILYLMLHINRLCTREDCDQ